MSFIDDFSETGFLGYLAERLQIDPKSLPQASDWSRFGNTIGATALRLNMLSPAQIDDLVETQESQGGYFGELAIKAGCLTPAQVGQLLEIQSLHDDLFLAEQLAIEGRVDLPSLLHNLANYIAAKELELVAVESGA